MTRPFVALVLLCLFLLPLSSFALEAPLKTLLKKNTLYQYLEVVEDTGKGERYLESGKGRFRQGGMRMSAPDKLLLEYYEMFFFGLAYLEKDPMDVLFVGLGCGMMPRYLQKHYPEVRVDIVEIDPEVLSIARKYFSFNENNMAKVHISDGRVFIKRGFKKYDIIFLDAYQNDSIPFHLTTAEFLREAQKRLKDDGMVIANIQTSVINKLFNSMLKTYQSEFSYVDVYSGWRSSNTVFIAGLQGPAPNEKTVRQRAKDILSLRKMDIDLPAFVSHKLYLGNAGVSAKPLTDDFAPVDVYRYMKEGGR